MITVVILSIRKLNVYCRYTFPDDFFSRPRKIFIFFFHIFRFFSYSRTFTGLFFTLIRGLGLKPDCAPEPGNWSGVP